MTKKHREKLTVLSSAEPIESYRRLSQNAISGLLPPLEQIDSEFEICIFIYVKY